ncbi:cupin domain-containing protein [Acidocella sp. KAb 2-4]|uniref:cupin domain-containing protein n=1 Tax=Acidocella sp. KAb 2-4 TaxID=2885158 RepID=UPI001D070BF5|nr:cupin domain-containing protein [Acidocella sp. KAb 2-4]MCB5945215.1 cupin domain-containing protein [Acidocella sp. KAb 2-4]
MSRLQRLAPPSGAPWEDVAAEKVLDGTPRTRSWVLYENPAERLYAGEWEATPGKWRIAYTEWEYMEIISGACVVEGGNGERIEAGPGDRFVIEPGFTGTWEVLSPMRKSWVIRE